MCLWSIGVIEEKKKGAGKIVEVEEPILVGRDTETCLERRTCFLMKVDDLYSKPEHTQSVSASCGR